MIPHPPDAWLLGCCALAALAGCGGAGEDQGRDGPGAADAGWPGDGPGGDGPGDGGGAADGAAGGDATASPDGGLLRPAVGATWQWQLDTPVDTTVAAQIFDIDLFDNGAATVATLHAGGAQVICYLSAGSWEDWRDDADDFPAAVLGKDYDGWPGERWLDVRRLDLLGPILQARLDLCRAKGFDGVEPDNIDGYTNDTGFPLTAADQLTFNRWLATEAHARGLSIGLKNDADQVADLLDVFDWALTEDCFAEGWCADLAPFVAAGKAVLAAEYTDTGVTLGELCPAAQALQLSPILKHRDLDAWRQTCPP
jgi:hypothetical protein